jgi:pilus assembly protein Flp/PilA
MTPLLRRLCAKLRRALAQVEGQDLVEYALIIACLAFACTAGMGSLASGINNLFTSIAANLTIA